MIRPQVYPAAVFCFKLRDAPRWLVVRSPRSQYNEEMFGSASLYFLIILSALASVTGNTLFRLGLRNVGLESLEPAYLIKNFFLVVFQPLVFTGFVFFAIGAVVWMRVLTSAPLNKSYPILVGLVVVFIVVSSTFLLREPFNWARIAGMALIVLGTLLVFV